MTLLIERLTRRAALAGAAFALASATGHAQSLQVRVDLTGFLCDKTTAEPYSDEPNIGVAWRSKQAGQSGKTGLPGPKQSYWNYQWLTTYPSFGNVDENEWVFTDARTVWEGWIPNGESIRLTFGFWEDDSDYTWNDYVSDMKELSENTPWFQLPIFGPVGPFLQFGAGVILGAHWLFGTGTDDPLGNLSMVLHNDGGELKKRLIVGEYSRVGGAYYDSWKHVKYWEVSEINALKSQGYVHVFNSGIYAYLRKPLYYGPLSKSRKTVRAVLDGAGGERYQASFQVRIAGACETWTKDSDQEAH